MDELEKNINANEQEFSNVDKWRNANYLIAAKNEVDSLWYIAKNQELIYKTINIDFRYLVELHRNTFYINAADVVDKFNNNKTKRKKKLCEINPIIDKLETKIPRIWAGLPQFWAHLPADRR